MAMQRIFSDTYEAANISDAAFISTSINLADRINFEYRSLIIFVIRNYRNISKKPSDKDLLAKSTLELNKTVFREFADLTRNLDFVFF